MGYVRLGMPEAEEAPQESTEEADQGASGGARSTTFEDNGRTLNVFLEDAFNDTGIPNVFNPTGDASSTL